MKTLSLSLLVVLAALTVTQAQGERRPVMQIADPDLYLELKHRSPQYTTETAPTMTTPTEPTKVQVGQTIEVDPNRDPLAEYLLYQSATEHFYPEKFHEEMGYLYGIAPEQVPERFRQQLLQARARLYTVKE